MPDGPDRSAEPAAPNSTGARSSTRPLALVLGALLVAGPPAWAPTSWVTAQLTRPARSEKGSRRAGPRCSSSTSLERLDYQAIYQAGQGAGRVAGQRTGELAYLRAPVHSAAESGDPVAEEAATELDAWFRELALNNEERSGPLR